MTGLSYGKAKCEYLKQLRAEINKMFDLGLEPIKCNHDGINCPGTCPACDDELQTLERLVKEKGIKVPLINIPSIFRDRLEESPLDTVKVRDCLPGISGYDEEETQLPQDFDGLTGRVVDLSNASPEELKKTWGIDVAEFAKYVRSATGCGLWQAIQALKENNYDREKAIECVKNKYGITGKIG